MTLDYATFILRQILKEGKKKSKEERLRLILGTASQKASSSEWLTDREETL